MQMNFMIPFFSTGSYLSIYSSSGGQGQRGHILRRCLSFNISIASNTLTKENMQEGFFGDRDCSECMDDPLVEEGRKWKCLKCK